MKEIEKYVKQDTNGNAVAAIILFSEENFYIVRKLEGENLSVVTDNTYTSHKEATRAFNKGKHSL